MEEIRIREKNILNVNIKDIGTYIKRHKDTIDRLQKQGNISQFDKNQIEKLKVKISDYEKELENINNKIKDIDLGNLDDEFVKRLNEERLKISKSNDKIQKKNVEKTKQINDNKKFVKASYDINGNYNSERIFEKEFNKFQDKCNNIPDYILRNLKEMPSNKGYIWKGIWCFGELPAEDTTLIMFEKVNGDLKIYEIDEYNRSIYEKKGKDKKVLISRTPRSDFIKHFRVWAKERGY